MTWGRNWVYPLLHLPTSCFARPLLDECTLSPTIFVNFSQSGIIIKHACIHDQSMCVCVRISLTSFGCCLKNATCHLDAHTVNLQYIVNILYSNCVWIRSMNIHTCCACSGALPGGTCTAHADPSSMGSRVDPPPPFSCNRTGQSAASFQCGCSCVLVLCWERREAFRPTAGTYLAGGVLHFQLCLYNDVIWSWRESIKCI